MPQLIECIPNFSEGRRRDVVDRIVEAIASVEGVTLLDEEMDPHHNRSVITMIGSSGAVEEAAFRATATAAQLIDLDSHRGEHPRIGATDVIPFVPISGATPADCVAAARRLGERIGRELEIPVYLYEDAATKEANRNLADVRRGEYEGLKVEIEANPERAPDFGPCRLGKAGAVAIGARFPLVAFNVHLGTTDLQIAKAIARAVRFSGGGLRYVKALGIELAGRSLVQVSMNMTNYEQTPLYQALELIRREASRYGVPVVESEIIGLVPEEALFDSAAYYLQLANFSSRQVLEVRLAEALRQTSSSQDLLDEIAAATAAPGGGSASAYAGALSASLLAMFAGLTLSKKKYSAVHGEMQRIADEARTLKNSLSAAVREDAAAFMALAAAYKFPRDTAGREQKIQSALQHATDVPMRVAEQSARCLRLAREGAAIGLASARTDAAVASHLAEAAVRGALLNVQENMASLTDDSQKAQFQERVGRVIAEIHE